MSDRPPSSYDFVPLPDRAPLKFPGGAYVALIFTINIEYWEPLRPGQKEPLFPGDLPWPLRRFATAESLAHLERLRREGRAAVEGKGYLTVRAAAGTPAA